MVGRYGALLSHLELAEYNADVNVEEVKDKSHSNVRGLINHLTSAIPAGKVPGGGSQAFQATQDAAFNKWLSLDNRAEAVSDRDNAVETIANRLTQPTPSGQYSPVDMIENEAERQNKTYGTPLKCGSRQTTSSAANYRKKRALSTKQISQRKNTTLINKKLTNLPSTPIGLNLHRNIFLMLQTSRK